MSRTDFKRHFCFQAHKGSQFFADYEDRSTRAKRKQNRIRAASEQIYAARIVKQVDLKPIVLPPKTKEA